MFRFRALALLGFTLLSGVLPVALIGQQAPDEVQIHEGARDVKSTIVVVDGKRYWKITAVIDEEAPPILAGEALPTIDGHSTNQKLPHLTSKHLNILVRNQNQLIVLAPKASYAEH